MRFAPGLPAGAADALLDLFGTINAGGQTILMVTHSAGQRPCWRLYACWAAQQRWQRPDCSA